MPLLPWIDAENFNPGYMMRGMHLLPKRARQAGMAAQPGLLGREGRNSRTRISTMRPSSTNRRSSVNPDRRCTRGKLIFPQPTFHAGLRFSTKAVVPSRPSSLRTAATKLSAA